MDLLSTKALSEMTFTVDFRGYNKLEVDQMMERTKLTLDVLNEQLQTMRGERNESSSQIDTSLATSDRANPDSASEKAVRLLDAARETTDKMMADATFESKKLMDDASHSARDTEEKTKKELARLEEEARKDLDLLIVSLNSQKDLLNGELTNLSNFVARERTQLLDAVHKIESGIKDIKLNVEEVDQGSSPD
jgi:cell division septum initiation protein DivIVA